MKNIYKSILVSIIFVLGFSLSTQADPPGMPGNHGSSGDQVPGGGAPIGSGISVLFLLGGFYAFNKTSGKDLEE